VRAIVIAVLSIGVVVVVVHFVLAPAAAESHRTNPSASARSTARILEQAVAKNKQAEATQARQRPTADEHAWAERLNATCEQARPPRLVPQSLSEIERAAKASIRADRELRDFLGSRVPARNLRRLAQRARHSLVRRDELLRRIAADAGSGNATTALQDILSVRPLTLRAKQLLVKLGAPGCASSAGLI